MALSWLTLCITAITPLSSHSVEFGGLWQIPISVISFPDIISHQILSLNFSFFKSSLTTTFNFLYKLTKSIAERDL